MSNAPQDLATFRTGTVIPLTGLSGNDVGIAPDAAHLAGGGYHVGCQDIQHAGKWNTDYSTRQSRDRTLPSTNDASAMDIGDDWPRGGRRAWLRFNRLLVGQLRAGDPALAALRAVNFSPDGTARKRYDSLHPEQGVIDSTDSVYMHTHLEWWRDTKGTAARARSLARIGQIIEAAITNTHLEDDMAGEIADRALAQLDGGNALGDVYLRLLTGKDGHGKPSGDGAATANLTTIAAKVDGLAAAAKSEATTLGTLVTLLQAATAGSGTPLDTAGVLQAIAAEHETTRQLLVGQHAAELAAIARQHAAEVDGLRAQLAAVDTPPAT